MRDLFTFGSLVVTRVMEAVTGRSFPSQEAKLTGYRAMLLRGECFPGLLRCERGEAQGRLYQDIDDVSWQLLDRFEGDYYRRTPVEVQVGAQRVAAYVYLLAPRYEHLLSQDPWDAQRFAERDLEPFLRMCGDFRGGERTSAAEQQFGE